MNKLKRFTIGAAVILFAAASLTITKNASSQTVPQRLAIKAGESIELHSVYYVGNCRSIMIGLPEIEVLEGPPEVSLRIREEPVLPRRQGCAAKVAGGTLLLTAKDVADRIEANFTYRLKYRTKDGPRETSHTYLVSLFP
jgi:hypothetical protein